MIDNFIIDFYCSKLLLAIEIDGGIHNKLKNKDKERSDVIFYKYGIKVIKLLKCCMACAIIVDAI